MGKGNFKVRCVKSNQPGFTTGKIYEIKNGKITDDDGEAYPLSDYIENIEQLKAYASSNKWELVHDNPTQTITIHQKGRKVIAVLTNADGEFIKAAKAKCSPEDAFDFEIGKKIAVKRLLGLDTIIVTNPNEPALPKKGLEDLGVVLTKNS